MSLSSDLQNMTHIIVKPQQAIDYLRSTPSLLVPMLLVPIAMTCWFFVLQSTSVAVLTESEMSDVVAQAPQLSEERLAAIATLSVKVLGTIWTAVSVYLGMLVVAGYLRVITPDNQTSFSYRGWLSLTAWAQIPYVLSAILGIAFLFLFASETTGFNSLKEMSPFALAYYLKGDSSGFIFSFLRQIDLFALWMLGILAVGYSKWTGRNVWLSALIVSGPYLAWWIFQAFLESM